MMGSGGGSNPNSSALEGLLALVADPNGMKDKLAELKAASDHAKAQQDILLAQQKDRDIETKALEKKRADMDKREKDLEKREAALAAKAGELDRLAQTVHDREQAVQETERALTAKLEELPKKMREAEQLADRERALADEDIKAVRAEFQKWKADEEAAIAKRHDINKAVLEGLELREVALAEAEAHVASLKEELQRKLDQLKQIVSE